MTIELKQFQHTASAKIADRFTAYDADPVVVGTRKNPRVLPYFQQLASLTASGKTPMLADAVCTIAAATAVPPVILWLSKGTVVVGQSLANLQPGGKYAHLLGQAVVRALSDYNETEADESRDALVYFATVGTFNQKDKEAGDRLIYKSNIDTAAQSTWESLKARKDPSGVTRPLIVVYDEAQNLSDQQTDLLMELDPQGFILASATPRLPQKLNDLVKAVQEQVPDTEFVTDVPASEVAGSGLVKDKVVLAGYKSPMEETIAAMLDDLAVTQADAITHGLKGIPKAVYVCDTNMVAHDGYRRDDPKRPFDQREAAPILIWRYLTEQRGVDPATIATYATLRFDKAYPPPPEFVLFKGGDSDYADFVAGDFQHIIFNKSLQEGWDDPLVYAAYVDRSMESQVAIEQVIGRLLRQPETHHFPADTLNTARFYVRVDRNDTFNQVLADVEARLKDEAPDIKVYTRPPGRESPVVYPTKMHVTVPTTAYDARATVQPIEALISGLSDYTGDTVNTIGEGQRRLWEQTVGGQGEGDDDWSVYEHSNQVAARWVFQREVKRMFAKALQVASTADAKFDAKVGLGSPAHKHIIDTAKNVVDAYVRDVVLVQSPVDPYVVGDAMCRPADVEPFDNAVHDGYDGLNPIEKTFAKAIDATGRVWCRNPSRTGYGIPLISLGPTKTFYPDFLIWDDDRVVAVDTKGAHLLLEAAGRKLLAVKANRHVDVALEIRFVSEGRFNEKVELLDNAGYSLWSRREDGTLRAEYHADMKALVTALLQS